MPFPVLVASGFTALEDSQYFQDNPIDAALRYDVDGGISISRRRFTRLGGRHIVTGFTEMSVANKALFDNFFGSMGGGSASFTYSHPLTAEQLQVRFEGEYTTAYSGTGSMKTWDVTEIKLRSP